MISAALAAAALSADTEAPVSADRAFANVEGLVAVVPDVDSVTRLLG